MEQNITMYDIKAKGNGNEIELVQTWHNGDEASIYLHCSQLEEISKVFGRRADDFRKLTVLRERLEDIVCDSWFRKELIERCADGELMLTKLDAILDLAYEYSEGLQPASFEDVREEAKNSIPKDAHRQDVSKEVKGQKPLL